MIFPADHFGFKGKIVSSSLVYIFQAIVKGSPLIGVSISLAALFSNKVKVGNFVAVFSFMNFTVNNIPLTSLISSILWLLIITSLFSASAAELQVP